MKLAWFCMFHVVNKSHEENQSPSLVLSVTPQYFTLYWALTGDFVRSSAERSEHAVDMTLFIPPRDFVQGLHQIHARTDSKCSALNVIVCK